MFGAAGHCKSVVCLANMGLTATYQETLYTSWLLSVLNQDSVDAAVCRSFDTISSPQLETCGHTLPSHTKHNQTSETLTSSQPSNLFTCPAYLANMRICRSAAPYVANQLKAVYSHMKPLHSLWGGFFRKPGLFCLQAWSGLLKSTYNSINSYVLPL